MNIHSGRQALVIPVLCGFVAVCRAVTASGGTPSSSISILSKEVPPVVSNGQAAPAEALATDARLRLAINLPLRNQTGLDQLLKQLYDPASQTFHQYLSVEQFTERFGPTQADYNTVVAWSKDRGLTVTDTTPNRHIVDVEGPVSAIDSAFNVVETEYRDPSTNRTFYAPNREPAVNNLSVPLLFVEGLDNYDLPHTNTVHSFAPVSNGSAPNGCYLPSDYRMAYYGTGLLTGAGQTIGIVSFNGYNPSSLINYYTDAGSNSPDVTVTNVLVDGFDGACSADGKGSGTCDDREQLMDIVSAVGMAPGVVQVLFYEAENTGSTVTDLLNRVAADNTAKVISSSWFGSGFGNADSIFQEFAAQGQTYLSASGDCGAYNTTVGTCNGTTNTSTYEPPSLDPYVLVVGGTALETTSPGGAWSFEYAWSGSGGGDLSGPYSTPYWQQYPNVVNKANGGSPSNRNSPDVAANADPESGIFDMDDGAPFGSCEGGTSLATPLWAGFVALANQQSVANGNGTLGFINPQLYGIGTSSYATGFHDIVGGSNPPQIGSGTGFTAVVGYDLVTGWGSPSAALIESLVYPAPTPAIFEQPTGYVVATTPIYLAVGDFNGDGKPDIAITNANNTSISVLLNSNGSFQSYAPTISTLAEPWGIVAADFNHDGKVDLAVADYGAGKISILLGNGQGTFPPEQSAPTVATGSEPWAIAVADFDRDGNLDMAVTNSNSSNVSVLFGDGTGAFGRSLSPAPSVPAPIGIVAGDFNGDGWPDLAVASSNGGVYVLLNNRDGTFSAPIQYPTLTGVYGIAAGDLNDDGIPDLVATNFGANSVSVFVGNGDGTFQPQATYYTGSSPFDVVIADVNGDGIPDIIVSNYGSNTVGVLLGNRFHTFQPQVTLATIDQPRGLKVADFRGEGFNDIAVVSNSGEVYVILNSMRRPDEIFKNGFELN